MNYVNFKGRIYSAKTMKEARKIGMELCKSDPNHAVVFYKTLKEAESKTSKPFGTLHFAPGYNVYLYGTKNGIHVCKNDGSKGKNIMSALLSNGKIKR